MSRRPQARRPVPQGTITAIFRPMRPATPGLPVTTGTQATTFGRFAAVPPDGSAPRLVPRSPADALIELVLGLRLHHGIPVQQGIEPVVPVRRPARRGGWFADLAGISLVAAAQTRDSDGRSGSRMAGREFRPERFGSAGKAVPVASGASPQTFGTGLQTRSRGSRQAPRAAPYSPIPAAVDSAGRGRSMPRSAFRAL
jgi:hypothetical protein